ncbi:MAG: flippase-like domain-containing protein [Nitrospirota bacterium]|nr:flippase-like domain-containing protein [Nitrospirota bacterium]
MLRLFLLVLGLLTFVGLVWHIGPAHIVEAATSLGFGVVLVILLPSVLMYLLEAYGWRLTLGSQAHRLSFLRLFAIRTAGETVNMTTPAAYVGGEPLKAYLLKRQGVPIVDAMASVVTAKTIMTLAEVLFILAGIIVSFWTMSAMKTPSVSATGSSTPVGAAVFAGALLLFGTVLFLTMQRRGLFIGLLGLLRRCRIRISYLESREDKLRALDVAINDFYARDRRALVLSLGMFFLGWLAESLEVYVILYCIGPPADVLTSISIGALAVVIKGGAFFIPGSIGAQEGGYLLLLMAHGYSDLAGITFAILRRVRELVWIVIGLICLAALGGFREPIGTTMAETEAGKR